MVFQEIQSCTGVQKKIHSEQACVIFNMLLFRIVKSSNNDIVI